MSHPITRRELLRRTGRGAALGALGLPLLRGSARAVAPSETIGLGIVGTGDLGRNHHLRIALGRPELRVVALCDVDRGHLEAARELEGGKAAVYTDFRDLLDNRDVDAVLVATPDHWHALVTIAACQAGKDVYCEKPLSLTVAEGRAMVAAARRYGRIVQTGSQQRSDERFRWACELVRNGRIGELRHVVTVLGDGPVVDWEEPRDPPADLDWDLWLGPAPRERYSPGRCHYTFRWFYDYSGGKPTDWGAHHNDIAQWAIGSELSGPVEVEGRAVFPAAGISDTPVRFDARFRYASGVTLECTSDGENGVTFQGSEGRIFVSRSTIEADPPEVLDTPPGAGPLRLRESRDHHQDWIDCIKSRELPICDVAIGHRSATVCHLANLAFRLGRKLRWDPENERFVGDEEANRLLSRPMRPPWSL
jgi:predicted dehydrogenase